MKQRTRKNQSSHSQCDNCRTIYNDDQLEEIDDLFERVEAGGVVPSGQCPDPGCGALCYPIKLMPRNKPSKRPGSTRKPRKKSRTKR